MKARTIRRSILLCSLVWLVALPFAAAKESQESYTLFLVRHAEKLNTEDDPALSDVGLQRSARLAEMLQDVGINAIWSSNYKRTRETARPLAGKLGLDVQIYDPRALHELTGRLIGNAQNALVVGHSNTTPELVRLLGGDPQSPIDDASEFDRLYILTMLNGKAMSTTLLRYSAK